MGNLPERWHRRLLRSAVHSRDPTRLRHLVSKGLDINLPISDVFWDTPLTYSVKCGYLEMVEALVQMPQCHVDLSNRNKHSALDEAVCAWLLAATAGAGASKRGGGVEGKQAVGKRYRILRCLLAGGADRLTLTFLDMLIFSALTTTTSGYVAVGKLVRVVCEKGSPFVKSALMSVLIPYRHTTQFIWTLIKCGAVPQAYLLKTPARPYMPLDNAILLIKACNHPKLLCRIDCDTSGQLDATNQDWVKYKAVLKLLTLSGHKVQSHVMSYCYRNHADIYAWMARYCRSPQKLSHLCRVIVRQQLVPSVPVAIAADTHIPRTLKHCLVFERLGGMDAILN